MASGTEIQKVIGMICATAEAIGTQITPAAAALIAGDLKLYDLNSIGLALAEVRRVARGRLIPADILNALAKRDGRPHGDEAWAIALSANDEHLTVVLTSEIQMAMAAARPVIDAGDMVAARRSFLMAYERLVQEARDKAVPTAWEVSLGSDKAGRVLAIQEAVRLGRLAQDKAILHLEHQAETPTTADGQAIAGLLTGKTAAPTNEKTRERLAQLRQDVIDNRAKREQLEQDDRDAKRADFERRRDEHLAKVAHLCEIEQRSWKE